jgi:hypothetical protein
MNSPAGRASSSSWSSAGSRRDPGRGCRIRPWVADLCAALSLPCQVANTSSETWGFKHPERNTDRDDAQRLAQLQARGQLPTVTVPPPRCGGAAPDARKDRLTGRKSRQESGRRPPYHSL